MMNQIQAHVSGSPRKWAFAAATGISLMVPSYFVWEAVDNRKKIQKSKDHIGDRVFLDVGIGDKYAGRVLIGLYSKTVPLTSENFLQLCKGFRIKDKVIGYRNTNFHMIRPGNSIVGGDVLLGTGQTRGLSIYGEAFPDENFELEFLREGDLAMINWGKNTNSSIFMITLSQQRNYYGHHVVFGTVMKGMRVIREVGEMGTRVGRPALPCRILQCGVVEEGKPLPEPPLEFVPKAGPIMSEEEFRAVKADKGVGTSQPS